jgi:hypothetical protein
MENRALHAVNRQETGLYYKGTMEEGEMKTTAATYSQVQEAK